MVEISAQAAWTAAFVAAQAEMPEIAKTKTAKIETANKRSFSYSYAELPGIIEAVRATLSNHGLAVAQSVESNGPGIGVATRIYHRDGHVETFGPIVLAAGNDARSAGSAITYARRYALCAALGIAPDDDDDAEVATKKVQRSEAERTGSREGTDSGGSIRELGSQSPAAAPSGTTEGGARSSQPSPPSVTVGDLIEQGRPAGKVLIRAREHAKRFSEHEPDSIPDLVNVGPKTTAALAQELQGAMPV
jgi:hypothetical protein